MTDTAHAFHGAPVVATPARRRVAVLVGLPVALYGVALAVYTWGATQVGFAANEGSAYYVTVARNLAAGRGLVVDAMWSYATPPLVLPRPAFELWQPLASFVAAGPMIVLGPSLGAGQLGIALVGALLAPLAWLVALDAARTLGADARRATVLAVGSAVLVAVLGPLVVAVALPDSTIPFAVAGLAACWLVGRSISAPVGDRPRLWLALGAVVGLAWLARHEAVWIALAALLVARHAGALDRRMIGAAVGGGLAVTGPWLVRNVLTFGTPLPSQALDNALLTSNEQIYAYLDRPSLHAFLEQGAPVLLGNVLGAAWHNLVNVLIVPAAPVAIVGLIGATILLARRRALRGTALAAVAATGLFTFAAATILFPVASLWGTFEHAAGPALVGLSVAAVLGLDRLVQLVGLKRGWRNANAWLAPLALVLLVLPLSLVGLHALAGQAAARADHFARLGQIVRAQPEAAGGQATIITDHPVWLADATGLAAIALPAEPLPAIARLAADFNAPLIVISDPRGGYPGLLRTPEGRRCFAERTPLAGQPPGTAVFAVLSGCRP